MQRIEGETIKFDFGNSGTSIRLMMGILSAQKFSSVLSGDSSLQKRPMDRISIPLKMMGADIKTTNARPPVYINPVHKLENFDYHEKIASAQIKSAILLASLYAKKTMTFSAPISRDHTEIMLKEFGCNITKLNNVISLKPTKLYSPTTLNIPGDISSAALIILGAIISKNSHVIIKNVGLNPQRTGFIEVLKLMGADITTKDVLHINGELVGTIIAKSSKLTGIDVPENLIASSIDEIPLIILAGSPAIGKTSIRNAKELRLKESDRIMSMVEMMKRFSINIDEYEDGVDVYPGNIKGSMIKSFGDHRIAMTAIIASLNSDSEIFVEDCKNIDTSFPSFLESLNNIGMEIKKY
jgi:3-phosphoshikimate 1-carboxyvinyltransferase